MAVCLRVLGRPPPSSLSISKVHLDFTEYIPPWTWDFTGFGMNKIPEVNPISHSISKVFSYSSPSKLWSQRQWHNLSSKMFMFYITTCQRHLWSCCQWWEDRMEHPGSHLRTPWVVSFKIATMMTTLMMMAMVTSMMLITMMMTLFLFSLRQLCTLLFEQFPQFQPLCLGPGLLCTCKYLCDFSLFCTCKQKLKFEI